MLNFELVTADCKRNDKLSASGGDIVGDPLKDVSGPRILAYSYSAAMPKLDALVFLASPRLICLRDIVTPVARGVPAL